MQSTKSIQDNIKGKWQWQSNKDPWSKSEPPQWRTYSLEHNSRLEKAFYEKEKEVDFGDYIVLIEEKLQKRKSDVTLQRPVRRIDNPEDLEDAAFGPAEGCFEAELPKIVPGNKIFRSLEDFIHFFSKRSRESLELTDKFNKFENSNDIDGLNEEILPPLVACLQKQLIEPLEKKLNDPSVSKIRKKILLKIQKHCEDLIALFQKKFSSFEEFYKKILEAYTSKAPLCSNLNRRLREENWDELDKLWPYPIFLCKAFFNLKLHKDLDNQQVPQESDSLILYRGTALDELEVNSDNCFSWNSVTSASTNRKVAKNFMVRTVGKYPVLFIIEVPLLNNSKELQHLKWIDIKHYSVAQNDAEVILPPGSIFEILEFEIDQEKTTIRIKLKNEVKSLAHRESSVSLV